MPLQSPIDESATETRRLLALVLQEGQHEAALRSIYRSRVNTAAAWLASRVQMGYVPSAARYEQLREQVCQEGGLYQSILSAILYSANRQLWFLQHPDEYYTHDRYIQAGRTAIIADIDHNVADELGIPNPITTPGLQSAILVLNPDVRARLLAEVPYPVRDIADPLLRSTANPGFATVNSGLTWTVTNTTASTSNF